MHVFIEFKKAKYCKTASKVLWSPRWVIQEINVVEAWIYGMENA